MTTEINGELTQNSSTSERILSEIEAIMLISKYIPLSQGDLVLTGTPAGALESIVAPGDRVRLSIEELGTLINKIELAV
jgi:5-oxopent-3-ene-1,2,5-tricarboxylate decarboxylase/2-hydroxyhepta-2,4-diene-1,7-dioate isomerase